MAQVTSATASVALHQNSLRFGNGITRFDSLTRVCAVARHPCAATAY